MKGDEKDLIEPLDEMSSKWSLEQLKEEYAKTGVDYNEVFKNIKSLCVKTLMAVEP